MNYIFMADGFETVEALAVVDIMKRAAIPLTMVAVGESLTVTSSHGVPVTADILFYQTRFNSPGMLILPGGMPGTVNLEKHEGLCALLKRHAADGGDLAAICAAPRVLGSLGILEGRKACCYPGNEDLLTGAEVTTAPVTVDGNIITSRGMGTAIPFAAAIVEKLADRETSQRILDAIIWS